MIELKSCVCSTEEQETTIQISRDGNEIRLYTSDNTRLTKMQKLINAPGTLWKLVKADYDKEGNPMGYFFVCSDKNMLALRVKPQVKEYTEEEKAALTARLKEARAKQLAQN